MLTRAYAAAIVRPGAKDPRRGIYDPVPKFWRAHTRTMTANIVTFTPHFNVISWYEISYVSVMCVCFHNSPTHSVFRRPLLLAAA